jgi:virginiamycin B lyase
MNFSRSALAGVVALMVGAPAAGAADFTNPVFTEFTGGVAPGLSADTSPAGVAPGPDGNVWMGSIAGPGRISKVTPAGVVTEFTGGVTPNLSAGLEPANLVAGPDGNVWVTEFAHPGGVVRITPSGAVTEYLGAYSQNSNPTGITVGPDDALWFAEYAAPGRVSKVTTAGAFSGVATFGSAAFSSNRQPRGVALGPDGNVWVTEFSSPGGIARITPQGAVTQFTGGVTPGFSFDAKPVAITAGPDGNLWFTEQGGSAEIGRITPQGVVTEFGVAGHQPALITSGPDGALWFTEQASPGGIGRITTAGVMNRFEGGTTPGFTADRVPTGITTGPDGNLWFTESGDPGAIVRIGPGPDPGPAPTATPAPGPAPRPAAPRVTAMAVAAPVVAGSPALLGAQVLGDTQHVDWDLNGDGKVEVSCPGDEPTLRFRPSAAAGPARAAAVAQVIVRAVGPGGAGPALTQAVTIAPTTPVSGSQKLVDAVARLVKREPAVYVCGRAADWGAASSELSGPADLSARYCRERTIVAGTLHVSGCLKPVHELADIPPAERGIVAGLARAVGVGSTAPSTVLKNPNRVLGQVDGYVGIGDLLVNGVDLSPSGDASIVVYTQADQIVSSNASLTVGGIRLSKRKDFSLDTQPVKGNLIPLGDFPTLPGPIKGLGAFSMVGDLGVTLVPAPPGGQAGAVISTELKLPAYLSIGGDEAHARVKLRVTADGTLVLEDMHIRMPDLWIGALQTKDLQLDFAHEGGDSVWRGQAQLCVVALACLRALPGSTPPGGVVIRNGELERAFVRADLDPGVMLYPNVFLTSIGAGVGLNPTRLFGSVGVKAMQIYKIDGNLVMAFPSAAAPLHLTREEIGGLTDEDYSHSYSRYTLAASGTAYMTIADLKALKVRLGGAYFVYEAPGYVHVGGDIEERFAGVITLRGRTNGQFNLANGRFNFGQDIQACIFDFVCRSSATRLSSVGVGACFTVGAGGFTVSMGGGVRFSPFKVIAWPLDGCKWSRFEDASVFGGASAARQARAAQTTGSFVVTIKRGDPSRAIRLDGAAGAPRVRVTAPGGQVLDSSDGPGTALTREIRILRSPLLRSTTVGLQNPRPGNYRIDALPLSPAITRVSEADDPPSARVTARVSGHGARRTLTYDVLPRPNQRVTFVETGSGGERPIATITGGRGTRSFSPAPGTGKRHIEAQFELNGIGSETKTVATFTPPSARLGRPAHVRVRRLADQLQVTWSRVAEAARYEIVTTLAGGGQRVTSTRRPTATIRSVARSSGGRVTVRAIAPLREGRAAGARFRASAPRKSTRFRPLPKFKGANGG